MLYTHPEIANALIKAGIVEKRGDSFYIFKFDELVKLIQDGKRWSDIGLPQLTGRITVRTTDPNASNSGTIFIALLAYQLNGGDVPDAASLPKVLPLLSEFIRRLGNMEQSSADLFQQYLTTGIGARPLVAGYESQLIEFALQNPYLQSQLQDKIMLYPVPNGVGAASVHRSHGERQEAVAGAEGPGHPADRVGAARLPLRSAGRSERPSQSSDQGRSEEHRLGHRYAGADCDGGDPPRDRRGTLSPPFFLKRFAIKR